MSHTGRAFLMLSTLIVLCLGSAVAARADSVIYESAILGPTGQGSCCLNGPVIVYDQFVGSRFHVSVPTQVTQVGGHLVSYTSGQYPPAGSIFGAIVRLSGEGALPTGNPFDNSVVAVTLFNPGYPSSDFLIPLSADLAPGDYALIFGTGQFGSPRSSHGGVLLTNNTALPGASFIVWNGTGWVNGRFNNARFVVRGNAGVDAIPEPTTFVMIATGLVGVGAALRRRRKFSKEN